MEIINDKTKNRALLWESRAVEIALCVEMCLQSPVDPAAEFIIPVIIGVQCKKAQLLYRSD